MMSLTDCLKLHEFARRLCDSLGARGMNCLWELAPRVQHLLLARAVQERVTLLEREEVDRFTPTTSTDLGTPSLDSNSHEDAEIHVYDLNAMD